MKCRIRGVSSYMGSFDFFFGVSLGEFLLRHSDNLSRALQSPNMSAAEAQQIVSMTVKTLRSLRTEESFTLYWTNTIKSADECNVSEPELPRKRKMPQRFWTGNSEAEFHDTVETHYRQIYYEALDVLITCIDERFNQPGYKIYRNLQELLLKCVKGQSYEEELQFVCQFYHNDLELEQLRLHLQLLHANFGEENSTVRLQSIFEYLKSLSTSQKSLLSEVCKVATLILVMPASNAISERSFSTLHCLKSYLRSTMTQTCLNSTMVLHIHKEMTDTLCLKEVVREFISKSEHRLNFFGKF